MNFSEILTKPFLLSYAGRINRARYWSYTLLAFGAAIVAMLLDWMANTSIFLTLLVLVNIYPSVCVSIKRWHDRDKSGWWLLIGFVPVIGGIWSFIELGCLKGSNGANRYGGDPLSAAGAPVSVVSGGRQDL